MMLWIDKFTEFCKNIGSPDGEVHESPDGRQHAAFVNEANQLWSFETDSETPAEKLTPQQQGSVLLQRTKENALRRLWDKEHGSGGSTSYMH